MRILTDFVKGGVLMSNTQETEKVMFNPLPDDKILDWSKLKQIADDILKCIKMKKKCNIGKKAFEKRRNCLLQASSPFLKMFSTAIYL